MKWDVKAFPGRNYGPRCFKCAEISSQRKVMAGIRLLNLSLSASMLVLLFGDVSLNPGPNYNSFAEVSKCKGFKFAHLNVQSLHGKKDLISLELADKKLFDCLTFSETWLDSSFSNEEIILDGFQVCILKMYKKLRNFVNGEIKSSKSKFYVDLMKTVMVTTELYGKQ